MLAAVILSIFLQDNAPMADGMRAEGKIYVVVGVLAIILIGLFVYLFTIDRKVSKLEKEKSEGIK
jgi:CcmD family protein